MEGTAKCGDGVVLTDAELSCLRREGLCEPREPSGFGCVSVWVVGDEAALRPSGSRETRAFEVGVGAGNRSRCEPEVVRELPDGRKLRAGGELPADDVPGELVAQLLIGRGAARGVNGQVGSHDGDQAGSGCHKAIAHAQAAGSNTPATLLSNMAGVAA